MFPPNHLIHDARIALDDLHDLVADVLIHIVRHGDAIVAVLDHLHCRVHCLQQTMLVDARQHKAALVQRLGTLRGRADAHRGEWLADASEKAALLR